MISKMLVQIDITEEQAGWNTWSSKKKKKKKKKHAAFAREVVSSANHSIWSATSVSPFRRLFMTLAGTCEIREDKL